MNDFTLWSTDHDQYYQILFRNSELHNVTLFSNYIQWNDVSWVHIEFLVGPLACWLIFLESWICIWDILTQKYQS